MIVTKTVTFDAAHHLPNYQGPCHNLHGHRWTLRVSISGPVNEETGMVMDFKDLEDRIGFITDIFDHNGELNQWVKNPTCENLLLYIADRLTSLEGLNWVELELEESPGSCATLTRNEFENLING
jgi:6-pyruvoyltetrahydropterin/6-carboxytetrahydropterin synthase